MQRADQARQLMREGKARDALGVLEPALRVDARNQELLSLAARAHLMLGAMPQAVATATRALAVGPHPEPFMVRGDALRSLGRTDEAVADFEAAVRLQPAHAELRVMLAAALEEAGRVDEARAALQPVPELYRAAGAQPSAKYSYERAKQLVHAGDLAGAVAEVDRALSAGPGSPGSPGAPGAPGVAGVSGAPGVPAGSLPYRMLLFLRAKACDRAGDYEGAWQSAQRAHTGGAAPSFDPAELVRAADRAIARWSREHVQAWGDSGVDDATAVFVAGMPRSGTSLIDQVIHAHPRAAGVGELASLEGFAAEADRAADLAVGAAPPSTDRCSQVARAYLREVKALAPGKDRIVNKALGNGAMLGHLARLFPATRIVHVVRDPRDVAVSCVTGGFNSARLPWVSRPEWVAEAWRQHERLMRHWHEVLRVPMLEVRYERFVAGGADELRRLIEFLGLEWSPEVERFHQLRRTVRTLSYDQVNRPLYTGSVGRWKNYERFLSHVAWPE